MCELPWRTGEESGPGRPRQQPSELHGSDWRGAVLVDGVGTSAALRFAGVDRRATGAGERAPSPAASSSINQQIYFQGIPQHLTSLVQ